MTLVFKNPNGRRALVRRFSIWLWIGAVLLSPIGLIWILLAVVMVYLIIDHTQTSLLRLSLDPLQKQLLIAYYKPWANFQLLHIPFSALSYQIEKASLKIYSQKRLIISIKANRYGLSLEQLEGLSQSLQQLQIATV
ncbi:MAG: hypothetical protein AAFN10_19955 [Bacteroidota bacterium]